MRRILQRMMGGALFLVIAASLVCLVAVSLNSNQAVLASPMPQSFEGEYSFDGQNFLPLTQDSDLSAGRGDLYLRGHFTRAVSGGLLLNYYCNHIGVEIRIDGELCGMDELIELEQAGFPPMRSMCGRSWKNTMLPEVSPKDDVEIRLYNPHIYGNNSAYREFLSTMCITGTQIDYLQKKLEAHGKPSRIIGSTLIVAALMILGASASAIFMRLKMGVSGFVCGLLTLFAGACIFFDAIDVCFWNELVVFNTYVWQLSAMLAVLLAGYCTCTCLTGRAKRAARIALTLSAALNAAMILLSFFGEIRIFDLLPVWAGSQVILCPLLIVCCVGRALRAKGRERLMPISCTLFFAAVAVDLTGMGMSIFSRGTCTKVVFVLLFILHIFITGKSLADQYVTSMRVDRMEKELEASRVAIMLSQIQPHFLYNSLSVIQELCHSEPLEAEKAIGRFAEFLRGNMTALTSEKVIPFADELHHIQSYLEIEKLRFGDQLTVRYDIEAEEFSLPTLTLQPLVENAVRHGVRKNENGGTVAISVRERTDCHEITIADDGPGFIPQSLHSGDAKHVGMDNVKKRLERMCGGVLLVDSAPGLGTRVTVKIPKEGRVC